MMVILIVIVLVVKETIVLSVWNHCRNDGNISSNCAGGKRNNSVISVKSL